MKPGTRVKIKHVAKGNPPIMSQTIGWTGTIKDKAKDNNKITYKVVFNTDEWRHIGGWWYESKELEQIV